MAHLAIFGTPNREVDSETADINKLPAVYMASSLNHLSYALFISKENFNRSGKD